MTRRTLPRRPGAARPLLVVAVLALAGCSSVHPGVTSTPDRSAATTATTAPTTTTTDPGLLAQSTTRPSSATAAFQAKMAALWQGVVDGSVTEAMTAFFPESAYLQVKAVVDPAADFTGRLVAEYGADVAAAHAFVAATGARASLVEVVVPASFTHWVAPGTCENRVGYYEVADSRLVYREGTTERSFGIASLISWRGVWYVVHLGAVVRPGSAGVVDDPQAGPGSSAPATSC